MLFFAFSAVAQQSKTFVETNFPLLSFPFQLTTQTIPIPSKEGTNYERCPDIKGDVISIITKATLNNALNMINDSFRKNVRFIQSY
jgi:hypothetical protein